MSNYHDGAHKAGPNEFQLILAAGLIRGFGRFSPRDMYEKAVSCFETLLEIKESHDAAAKVSSLIDDKVSAVQKTVEDIIDLLLFNSSRNPYLSLGLPRNAGSAAAAKRWKRLIVLYHPYKYPDQKEYEEKAKKINEAYEEIQAEERSIFPLRPDSRENTHMPPVINTMPYRRYLRHMPAFILALAILTAIFAILVLAKAIQQDRANQDGSGAHQSLHEILPAPGGIDIRLRTGGEFGGIA